MLHTNKARYSASDSSVLEFVRYTNFCNNNILSDNVL